MAKCPYCGTPNDISDFSSNDDDELAALLEEERKKVAGGRAASAFSDPTAPAKAPGPAVRKPIAQKSPGWRQAPAKKPDFERRVVDIAVSQILAICVLILGTGEFIAAIAGSKGVFANAVFGAFGWLLAWGAWQEHRSRRPNVASTQVWEQIEYWLGVAAAVCVGLFGTVMFAVPGFPVLTGGFSHGFSSHAMGYLVAMFLAWFALLAYSIGLFALGGRQKVFTLAGWTYVAACGILLLCLTPFSEGAGNIRAYAENGPQRNEVAVASANPSAPVEPPAANNPPSNPPANNAAATTPQPAPNQPAPSQPAVPQQGQSQLDSEPTTPAPKVGEEQQGPASGTAAPSGPPQIPWQAAADPNPNPVAKPWVRQPAIPMQAGELASTSSPSPLVVVLTKNQTEPTAELWDLSTACSKHEIRGSFDFKEVMILSRDGKYLAGAGEFGIEIWSLESGKLLARLPLDKHAGDTLVDFLADDNLLVLANTPKSTQIKIWNFGADPNVHKTDLPTGVMLDGKTTVVSPGRHYLAAYGQGNIWVVDLAKGEVCGMLPVGKPEEAASNISDAALCFSQDGQKLSGLFGNSQGSRLMEWSLADGSTTANFDLSEGTADHGKSPMLQSFPDNQGWLVSGRVVVDRSGQPWPIIRHELRILGLADNDHLIVANEQMLSTWKLARQQDGRLKVATLEIQKEDLPPVFSGETGAPQAGDALNRASKRYRNQVEVDVLAADDSVLLQTLRWCPLLKQPYLGMRWGVGVQTQMASTSQPAKLEDSVGPMGSAVVNELQRRIDSGIFGQDPQVGDPRFSGVLFLGSGSRSELLSTANKMGLSAVVLFQIPQQIPNAPKRPDEQMKIFVVDSSGKQVWEHSAPNTAPSAGTSEPDAEEIASIAADIGKYLDDNYALQSMPEMQPKELTARIKRMGSEAHDDLLNVLAEVRYYQLKGLLSNEEAVAAFRTWLSDERAQALVNGTQAQRRAMLEQWLKTAKT